MLYKALPRSEARCLEDGTAQPERYSLCAFDAAAIRADGRMELAIAKLQLKRKLAEAAEHSITSKWLPVASMSQEVRLHQSLGGLVSEREVLLRSSDEGFEPCSMS